MNKRELKENKQTELLKHKILDQWIKEKLKVESLFICEYLRMLENENNFKIKYLEQI